MGCHFNSISHRQIIEAQEYIESRQYQLARDVLVKSLSGSIKPKNKIKVLHQLGVLYAFYLNDTEKALNSFKKIIELNFDRESTVKATDYLADLLFSKLRDFNEAEHYYKKLIQFNPKLSKHSFYYLRYVKSLFENFKFQECLTHLEILKSDKAMDINDLLFLEGLSYFYLNEPQKALKFLKKIDENKLTKSKAIEVRFYLGNIYETLEDLERAYQQYFSIRYAYPNPKVINTRLEKIISRKKAMKR